MKMLSNWLYFSFSVKIKHVDKRYEINKSGKAIEYRITVKCVNLKLPCGVRTSPYSIFTYCHKGCELSDKLVNTFWQIYVQKQRRAITILFCDRWTSLNYLLIFSIFWKYPNQEIKVFFTFLKDFFSKILRPCSLHVPAAALRDLDLDLWQGTADYLVLPGLWLPLVTRSPLRHPLAAMKASQPSDKYGFH